MKIKEFSKRRIRKNISLRDEMIMIFHGCVKMVKETLKMEEEEGKVLSS